MSKGRKADLNVARRELEASWEAGEEALERFRSVYDETMRRIGAGEHYLFPAEYYRELAAGLGNRLGVALARRGNEVVGGSLFMADRRYAHYHLSGATDAGRELKAGTLLVHEGAVWATARVRAVPPRRRHVRRRQPLRLQAELRRRGAHLCVRHPGRGSRRYDALVARRAEEPEPPRPGFFPAYRA